MNRITLFIGIAVLVIGGWLLLSLYDDHGHESGVDWPLVAKEPVRADGTFSIVTSFYPLAFIVEQLTGDLAEVQNLSAGQDPHDYQLTTRDRLAIERADLVIIQGTDFEPWGDGVIQEMRKKQAPLIVATTQLNLREYEDHDDEESHEDEELHEDDEDDHGHGLYDPHTWLDPLLMKQKVETIATALSTLDPENAATYEANATTLLAELDALHEAYVSALSSCAVEEAIISHDAFGYLTNRYGIKTHAIAGLSTQDTPSATLLAALAAEAEEGITTILTEESSVTEFAETLARETGLALQPINPIAFAIPDGEDYFSLMRSNLDALVLAYSCGN
jgi:zinc transport system substrate-binding protein